MVYILLFCLFDLVNVFRVHSFGPFLNGTHADTMLVFLRVTISKQIAGARVRMTVHFRAATSVMTWKRHKIALSGRSGKS